MWLTHGPCRPSVRRVPLQRKANAAWLKERTDIGDGPLRSIFIRARLAVSQDIVSCARGSGTAECCGRSGLHLWVLRPMFSLLQLDHLLQSPGSYSWATRLPFNEVALLMQDPAHDSWRWAVK